MKVYLTGAGLTKFGELWHYSLEDLAMQASKEALSEARVSLEKIEALYVGNMLYGKLANQDQLGALIASNLGLTVPAYRVEGACASGGLAVNLAWEAVSSGRYKNVVVVGAEKMSDDETLAVTSALMGAGGEDERKAGLTFPGLYAMMARAHSEKYGTQRSHLSSVAIKNHFHASLNDKAQFQYEIDEARIVSSIMVCDPLTLYDSSPISDGAAAVVLSSEGSRGDVYISASQVAVDSVSLSSRETLWSVPSAKLAVKKAFEVCGKGPEDVDIAEVHDCFTIAEIMAMEDLGFCKAGEGGEFIQSGKTRLGSKLAVNTSGGLKACGHPVGATGVKQIVEVYCQLRGASGKRQTDNPKVGLTHNVGGTGATAVLHILQK